MLVVMEGTECDSMQSVLIEVLSIWQNRALYKTRHERLYHVTGALDHFLNIIQVILQMRMESQCILFSQDSAMKIFGHPQVTMNFPEY